MVLGVVDLMLGEVGCGDDVMVGEVGCGAWTELFYHFEEYWCLAQQGKPCFSEEQHLCLLLKMCDWERAGWVWLCTAGVHWLWCLAHTVIFSLGGLHLEEMLSFAEEVVLGEIWVFR